MSGAEPAIESVFISFEHVLVSMDFERVASAFAAQGVSCEPMRLRRAEARGRVAFDAVDPGDEDRNQAFERYLTEIIAALPDGPPVGEAVAVAAEVAPRLAAGGQDRLWSYALPGVAEALREIARCGVSLHVVANFDGSAARGLGRLGLRRFFASVTDSAVVGARKPDPEIFEHALRETSTPPGAVLHVGGRHRTDVVGAQRAGLQVALLDPFLDWEHVSCPRPADLASVARRLRGEGTAGS